MRTPSPQSGSSLSSGSFPDKNLIPPSGQKGSAGKVNSTVLAVIFSVSLCHFINDLMQSMLPSIYPILSASYGLSMFQIGVISATFHITGSVLQPLIGLYTDKRPLPYCLPFAPLFTLSGILLLANAGHYAMLILGAAFIGIGSSIFHPEASRVARLASGGRYGFAQSIFQVGGTFGSAIGPLLVAFFIVLQGDIAIFATLVGIALITLSGVVRWYARHIEKKSNKKTPALTKTLNGQQINRILLVLFLLMVAKFVYHASMVNFYTFFAMEKFGVTTREAQILLFLHLSGMAIGTVGGGLLGDRIGPRTVIWFSILGVLPFTLALPHVDVTSMAVLSALIGIILASAFPSIVVFAQELLPGRVGMVAGLCFGLSFGLSAIAAAGLGALGDRIGMQALFEFCSLLPFLGLIAIFLPKKQHS